MSPHFNLGGDHLRAGALSAINAFDRLSVGTTGHNAALCKCCSYASSVPGQLSKHFLYNKMPNEIERELGEGWFNEHTFNL